jgi:deoxyribodipyrimidine photo-lyase
MPPAGKKHRRIVVWMRRALRVDDNTPLWQALQDAEEVIPLLVLRDSAEYRTDTPRRRFLCVAIADLDRRLRDRGTQLHIRVGRPEDQIPAAAAAYGADAVYAARVYDAPALQREAILAKGLQGLGVTLMMLKDRVLREGTEILNASGSPYKVFTPYKKVWLAAGDDVPRVLPAPERISPVPLAKGSISLSSMPGFRGVGEGGGESAALDRLRVFTRSGIGQYKALRDLPGMDGTSRLSAHLSVGTISPRTVYWAARKAGEQLQPAGRFQPVEKAGISTYISELIWREFYYQILMNFPFVQHGSFKEDMRNIRWRKNESRLDRWTSGLTGYPIVDAAMRQLNSEGWMHNRSRMIVASFLTKDLHVNWQEGERYFFDRLIDADFASNNGGWQWSAGTGTDASPWFRIFNPVSQGKKFDPEGVYIRRYVPELSSVPVALIHEPWKMSRQDQEAWGCRIGRDYPARMVDHSEQRIRTIALYKSSRTP